MMDTEMAVLFMEGGSYSDSWSEPFAIVEGDGDTVTALCATVQEAVDAAWKAGVEESLAECPAEPGLIQFVCGKHWKLGSGKGVAPGVVSQVVPLAAEQSEDMKAWLVGRAIRASKYILEE